MKRIERIQSMEEKYDAVLSAVTSLDQALESFEEVLPLMDELMKYYQSASWRKDFEADEAGKLPKDLKRGVLSEDGLYNLFSDVERLKERVGEKE